MFFQTYISRKRPTSSILYLKEKAPMWIGSKQCHQALRSQDEVLPNAILSSLPYDHLSAFCEVKTSLNQSFAQHYNFMFSIFVLFQISSLYLCMPKHSILLLYDKDSKHILLLHTPDLSLFWYCVGPAATWPSLDIVCMDNAFAF